MTNIYIRNYYIKWRAKRRHLMNILVTGAKGMGGTALVNNLKNIRDHKNGGWKGMIDLVIKQRIILAHIDRMSNRAIANPLHLSKDTVNKYVNEYNEKREELLRMHPDMDTAEIIQAFIEKPTYDSSNRLPTKATPELLEAVEQCLQLNQDKRFMGLQKQTMKKIDIYAYLKKQSFLFIMALNIAFATSAVVMKKAMWSAVLNTYGEKFSPVRNAINSIHWRKPTSFCTVNA